MARLLAFDFGTKRIGMAVTDPDQIVASPYDTIRTHEIFKFLEDYLTREDVEAFVVGMPRDLYNQDSHSTVAVNQFVKQLKNKFETYPVHLHDERFTSKMALDTMIRGGSKKSDRREKGNVDKISAAIILQSFMEARSFRR